LTERPGQFVGSWATNSQAKEHLKTIIAGLEGLSQCPEIKKSRFDRRITEKTLVRSDVTLACVLNRLDEKEEADLMLRKAEKPNS
jgi:hypothetical protein